MAERAKLFLTEGERLRPHKATKPARKHPWREPMKAKTRILNPVHVSGSSDDEILMREAPMPAGCYVKRNPT